MAKVEPKESLFERHNFNELTYKDLKEDLGWFMYGTQPPAQPINTISEVDEKIKKSAVAFDEQIKNKEKDIGQAQAENEKKLFYTFLYAARNLWKRLVSDPKATFIKYFSTKEVLANEAVQVAKEDTVNNLFTQLQNAVVKKKEQIVAKDNAKTAAEAAEAAEAAQKVADEAAKKAAEAAQKVADEAAQKADEAAQTTADAAAQKADDAAAQKADEAAQKADEAAEAAKKAAEAANAVADEAAKKATEAANKALQKDIPTAIQEATEEMNKITNESLKEAVTKYIEAVRRAAYASVYASKTKIASIQSGVDPLTKAINTVKEAVIAIGYSKSGEENLQLTQILQKLQEASFNVTILNIEKYLSEEEFQRIKEEANYKVTPLEALQQKTASYITKPFDRLSNSLEKLIKLWVPYRFMYYTIYDQDPHQIEDFKDKIREFEANEKLQSGSFDRMMLSLIQLIQLSSINNEYRAAILKDLGSIFGNYNSDTSASSAAAKGGAVDPSKVSYLANVKYPTNQQQDLQTKVYYITHVNYTGPTSDKKKIVAYLKDLEENPEKKAELINAVILEVLNRLATTTTEVIDTILTGKQPINTDTLIQAISLIITEGLETALKSSAGDEKLNFVVNMFDDTVKLIEGMMKEKMAVAVAPEPEPEPEPVLVPAQDKRREELIQELKNKKVLNDATLTCDDTITTETLEALNNNVAAVLSFLGLQNITGINDDELTKKIYSKDTTNRISDKLQPSQVNTPIYCSDPALTDLNNLFVKLKSHIDLLTQVRVVLSFNKGVPDYFNEQTMNDIVANQLPLPVQGGNNVGPFYKYLTEGTKEFIETDVASDIAAALQEKKHIIYTGYGFSGSGKSYTLLEGGEDTILGGVLKKLEGNDGVTVHVYELYGEDPDTEEGECKSTEPITPGQIYYYNISNPTNITYGSTPFSNPINVNDFTTNKDSILKNIQTVRQNNYKKEGEPTEFHIRPTPNNPNSSRAHIFYEFTIPNTGSKITLIDMGGTENVDDIEEMYYTVDKIYDAKNDSIQKILQDNFNFLTTKTFNRSGDTLTIALDRDLIKPLNNITGELQINTPVPNRAAWETLKDTTILSEDEFNIITKYISVLDTVKQAAKYYVRNIVDSVLLPDYTKSIIDEQLNKTALSTGKPKFNNKNKSYILTLLLKCYTLDTTSTTYKRKSTFMYTDALECYLVLKALVNDTTFADTDISNFKVFFPQFLTSNDSIYVTARNSYTNFIASIQSTSTTITTNDEAEKAFTDFTAIETEFKALIQKYHCPLRRQGNYINRSIKDLEYFAYDLTGDTTTKQEPTEPTKLAELLTKDFQPDYRAQTKLTVIAALRTDDGHKQDINKTLAFAHCINPFSNKNPPNYNCATPIMTTIAGGAVAPGPTPTPSPQPTPPPTQSPSTEPLITPAKITEDVDAVKTYLKKSTELKQVLADVESVWTSYTKVTPQKTFKDLKIYSLLDSLIGELKKDMTDTIVDEKITVSTSENFNIFRVVKQKSDNDTSKYATSDGYNYNYNKDGSPSAKEKFIQKRKAFISQLKDLATALDNNATTFLYAEKINKTVKDIGEILDTKFSSTPIVQSSEIKEDDKEYFKPIEYNKPNIYVPDIKKIQTFLEGIKSEYNKIPGYTAEEVKGTNSYLQKSAETIKKDLVDKLTKVSTEYSKLIDDLTKQAKRYATFNPSIKNRILLALEPKDGSQSEVSKIMERINFIIGKMKADIDVNKSSFEKAAEGMKTEKKGGGYLLCHPAYLAQLGGATPLDEKLGSNQYRIEIDNAFDKTKEGEDKNLYKYINAFEQLAKTFVNNLQRSTDPVFSLTTQGNESLFNTLFNKYKESKADTSKGEYVAAMELSEGLEANNLLPRKVLAIDYLDKTIFIFATLFIRLIALTITDYLIDTDKLQRLGYAFLAYLGIYIGIFYVLLLIVNLDDYKLRIILNYMNMHGNASVAIQHPALVAIFGAIIYYVMLNINKGYGYTVASEEDRVRLKYKIQVITLVIWMFTSLLVLLM